MQSRTRSRTAQFVSWLLFFCLSSTHTRGQVSGTAGTASCSSVTLGSLAVLTQPKSSATQAQGRAIPFRPIPSRQLPAGIVPAPQDKPLAPQPSTSVSPKVASPSPTSSFVALPDDGTTIPPDTDGAVGPNHLMVALNDGILIQSRSGATVKAKVTLDSFWGTTGVCDPHVQYEPFNSRWIFVAASGCDNGAAANLVLVAVSQNSDPTQGWTRCSAPGDGASAALFADFPSVGFNKTWIVVGYNMFSTTTGQFSKGRIFAYDKADLYAGGSSINFTRFDGLGGESPAITYDNTLATVYLLNDLSGNSSGHGVVGISTITGTLGSEMFTENTSLVSTVNAWEDLPLTNSGSDFLPQSGTAQLIQGNDSRILKVVYRNGSLWASHTVFLPAGTGNRSAAQWWQLSPTGTIQQFGRVDDSSGVNFYAFPTLAVNKNNDMLLGYSHYSASIFAEAAYSFRAATDPANTLQSSTVLKTGEASYFKDFSGSQNRWGDFSNTVVDPANDLDIWTIQEYAAFPAAQGGTCGETSCWGTWWGKITAPATVVKKRHGQLTTF
jgi:hypothetical protein